MERERREGGMDDWEGFVQPVEKNELLTVFINSKVE